MPFAGGTFYTLEGDATKPVLVLSHSLGAASAMWEPQRVEFLEHFRLLAYDTRGHGRSSVPAGPYTIAQLGQDVVDLLDAMGISTASFCGLSMGGMVGQWLGAHAAQRIDRLVLSNTAAKIGTAEDWNARIQAVRDGGMAAIVPAVLRRWFTPSFRERYPRDVEATAAMLLATSPEGYNACCGAIRDMDQQAVLGRIQASALVLIGTYDQATSHEEGQRLAAAIPRAQLVELPAAHLGNVEAPDAFTAATLNFLLSPGELHHG